MPLIPFSAQTYERRRYDLPPQMLVNLFHENSPVPGRPSVLLSAPALVRRPSVADGPIRLIFQEDGVLDDAAYIVGGSTLYKDPGTGLQTMQTGLPSGRIQVAASHREIALAVNGRGFIIDSVGLNQITDPDFPEVIDVAYINGYFLWVRKDSGQFVWSTILDGSDYDGLDFATAEESPDNLRGVIVDHEEILLFGTTTIETWLPTGDSEAPFVRRLGATRERGVVSQASIAQLDNSVFFVGDDRIAYRIGDGLERISSFAIEEALSNVAYGDLGEINGRSYAQDGHTFYILDIPGSGTYAFDLATGVWHERQSWGQGLWEADSLARVRGDWWAGSRLSGSIYTLDPDSVDDEPGPFLREATAGVPVQAGRPPAYSVSLDVQTGDAPITGAGSDPTCVMSFSDDLGRTWSNDIPRSMGRTGEYNKRLTWRRLGRMRSPGRIYRFRVTDPVPVVIHGARIDEYMP